MNVRFGEPPAGGFALTGTPGEMLAALRRYEAIGIEEMAFSFGETDAERVRDAMERFDRDVLDAFRAGPVGSR